MLGRRQNRIKCHLVSRKSKIDQEWIESPHHLICWKGLFALSKKCCEDSGLEHDGERVLFQCSKLNSLLLTHLFFLIFCSTPDLPVHRDVLSKRRQETEFIFGSGSEAHSYLSELLSLLLCSYSSFWDWWTPLPWSRFVPDRQTCYLFFGTSWEEFTYSSSKVPPLQWNHFVPSKCLHVQCFVHDIFLTHIASGLFWSIQSLWTLQIAVWWNEDSRCWQFCFNGERSKIYVGWSGRLLRYWSCNSQLQREIIGCVHKFV